MTTKKCGEPCAWCGNKCVYIRFHAPLKKHNCGEHDNHPLEGLRKK